MLDPSPKFYMGDSRSYIAIAVYWLDSAGSVLLLRICNSLARCLDEQPYSSADLSNPGRGDDCNHGGGKYVQGHLDCLRYSLSRPDWPVASILSNYFGNAMS